MNKNIITTILACYFFTFLISNLKLVYDRYSVQFLAIGVLNLISFGYLFTRFSFKEFIDATYNSKPLLYYSGFILISILSISVANNKIEALIIISQYLSFFFIFQIINFINHKSKIDFIKLFLSFCIVSITIESLFIFYLVASDIFVNEKEFTRSIIYSGFAANNNIAAFSLVVKSPILIFKIIKEQKKLNKALLLLILFIVIFCLLSLLSRGAILAFLFSITSILIISILYKMKKVFSSAIIISLTVAIGYILSSQILNNSSKTNLIDERISSIEINTDDQSFNERLRYYNAAIQSIYQNPLLGIGVGNWKIESINYDSQSIKGYRIPFHAHNDFLQVGAESGIIALSFFMMFLFYPFFRLLKTLYNKQNIKNIIYFILLVSLSVFIFDALINFPISRPISHIYLLFLIMALTNINRYNEG